MFDSLSCSQLQADFILLILYSIFGYMWVSHLNKSACHVRPNGHLKKT